MLPPEEKATFALTSVALWKRVQPAKRDSTDISVVVEEETEAG